MNHLILPFKPQEEKKRSSRYGRMPMMPPSLTKTKHIETNLKHHPLNTIKLDIKDSKQFGQNTSKKIDEGLLTVKAMEKNNLSVEANPTSPKLNLLTVEAIEYRNKRTKDAYPLLEPYMKAFSVASVASTSKTSASTKSSLSNTEDLFNQFIPFAAGGMGQLIKAYEKDTKREVLIKTVRKDAKMKNKEIADAYQSLVDEYAIQAMLDHKNILSVEQLLGSSRSSKKRCIVLPRLNGPDLFDFMAQDCFEAIGLTPALSEDISGPIMKQMLAATAHCHEMGIAHRDIKPENFVFEEPVQTGEDAKNATLKMIDFGGAAHTGVGPDCVEPANEWINYILHPGCFTYGYAAPEQLTKGTTFSMQCDTWALGIIMFQMFHKCLPAHLLGVKSGEPMEVSLLEKIPHYLSSFFEISNPESNCCGKETCQGTPSDRKSKNADKAYISRNAYCLLTQLLTVDAKVRITAKDALKHSFFD